MSVFSTVMGSAWRLKIFAVGAIFTIVGDVAKAIFDNDPATVVNWDIQIPAFLTAIGLLLARNNTTTSEQAGAK